MRIVLALAVLVACGGGGGGDAAFAPSADLAATHPWLGDTLWNGSIQTDGTSFALQLGFGPLTNSESVAVGVTTQAPGIPGNALAQADGNRIRLTITNNFPAGELTTVVLEGQLTPQAMNLTWRRESTLAPFDGDTGTAALTRTSPPLPALIGVEVYDTPELLLVVRREWR